MEMKLHKKPILLSLLYFLSKKKLTSRYFHDDNKERRTGKLLEIGRHFMPTSFKEDLHESANFLNCISYTVVFSWRRGKHCLTNIYVAGKCWCSFLVVVCCAMWNVTPLFSEHKLLKEKRDCGVSLGISSSGVNFVLGQTNKNKNSSMLENYKKGCFQKIR